MTARRRFGRQVSFWLLGLLLVLLLCAASAPSPLYGVYQSMWQFPAMYAVGAVVIAAIPDPVLRRPGWIVSMRPTVDVPAAARPIFLAGLPAVIGMWALAGLYLSLGPSLASQLLATDNRAAGGLVIFALAGTGAVTAAVVRSREPNRLLVRGSALVIVGVSITLVGQFLSSVTLLYGGSIVAGVGLGAGFSAYVRATAPLVAPERRGALVAVIYVAVYVSFSVPTVLAGAAVSVIGLAPTAYGYGAIVVVLSAITTIAVSRRLRDLGGATLPTSR